MVILLCVCVCLFKKKLGKLQTLTAQTSYWQASNYTGIKNNNRLLLKPFSYKVMTIYITVSRLEKTPGDNNLNITTTVS